MKVLLIDDHPLIVAALQSVIEGLGDNVSVVTAHSAHTARERLRSDPHHDLVLLDLHLGDADGFELLGELRLRYPAVPVVVISASDRSGDVVRAIDMGAMGFVPKRASNEVLFDALKQVLSGGVYVPHTHLSGTTHIGAGAPLFSVTPQPRTAIAPGTNQPAGATPCLRQLGLTPRQADVLGLLLKGQPNKLIARELTLSVETVKDHVAAVLRALGVSSRTQAVIAVSQMLQRQSQALGMGWQTR